MNYGLPNNCVLIAFAQGPCGSERLYQEATTWMISWIRSGAIFRALNSMRLLLRPHRPVRPRRSHPQNREIQKVLMVSKGKSFHEIGSPTDESEQISAYPRNPRFNL